MPGTEPGTQQVLRKCLLTDLPGFLLISGLVFYPHEALQKGGSANLQIYKNQSHVAWGILPILWHSLYKDAISPHMYHECGLELIHRYMMTNYSEGTAQNFSCKSCDVDCWKGTQLWITVSDSGLCGPGGCCMTSHGLSEHRHH